MTGRRALDPGVVSQGRAGDENGKGGRGEEEVRWQERGGDEKRVEE